MPPEKTVEEKLADIANMLESASCEQCKLYEAQVNKLSKFIKKSARVRRYKKKLSSRRVYMKHYMRKYRKKCADERSEKARADSGSLSIEPGSNTGVTAASI